MREYETPKLLVYSLFPSPPLPSPPLPSLALSPDFTQRSSHQVYLPQIQLRSKGDAGLVVTRPVKASKNIQPKMEEICKRKKNKHPPLDALRQKDQLNDSAIAPLSSTSRPLFSFFSFFSFFFFLYYFPC